MQTDLYDKEGKKIAIIKYKIDNIEFLKEEIEVPTSATVAADIAGLAQSAAWYPIFGSSKEAEKKYDIVLSDVSLFNGYPPLRNSIFGISEEEQKEHMQKVLASVKENKAAYEKTQEAKIGTEVMKEGRKYAPSNDAMGYQKKYDIGIIKENLDGKIISIESTRPSEVIKFIKFGHDNAYDFATQTLTKNGEMVYLNKVHRILLEYLLLHKNTIIEGEKLIKLYASETTKVKLGHYIYQLRNKVQSRVGTPCLITIYNKGYKLIV